MAKLHSEVTPYSCSCRSCNLSPLPNGGEDSQNGTPIRADPADGAQRINHWSPVEEEGECGAAGVESAHLRHHVSRIVSRGVRIEMELNSSTSSVTAWNTSTVLI